MRERGRECVCAREILYRDERERGEREKREMYDVAYLHIVWSSERGRECMCEREMGGGGERRERETRERGERERKRERERERKRRER